MFTHSAGRIFPLFAPLVAATSLRPVLFCCPDGLHHNPNLHSTIPSTVDFLHQVSIHFIGRLLYTTRLWYLHRPMWPAKAAGSSESRGGHLEHMAITHALFTYTVPLYTATPGTGLRHVHRVAFRKQANHAQAKYAIGAELTWAHRDTVHRYVLRTRCAQLHSTYIKSVRRTRLSGMLSDISDRPDCAGAETHVTQPNPAVHPYLAAGSREP